MLKQQVRGGQGNRSLHPCAGVNRTAPFVAQRGGPAGAIEARMTTHDVTAAPQVSAPSTCTLKIHNCLHLRIGPNQQIPGLLVLSCLHPSCARGFENRMHPRTPPMWFERGR